MATLRRFTCWLVSTIEGRVLMVLVIGLALFRPDLLTKLVRSLFGGILGAIVNGISGAIGAANQGALSSLFILALMIYGIVYMFKALFKKGGGKSK